MDNDELIVTTIRKQILSATVEQLADEAKRNREVLNRLIFDRWDGGEKSPVGDKDR